MKIRKVPDPAGGNLQSQAAIDCVRDFLEFGLQSQSFKELNPVFVRVTEGARAWNGDFALFAQSRIKGESGLLAKGGHKLIIFGYEAQKGEKLAKVKVKINGNDYILSLGRQDAYTLVFSLPQPQTASVLLQLSRESGINNQSVKAFIKSMYVE